MELDFIKSTINISTDQQLDEIEAIIRLRRYILESPPSPPGLELLEVTYKKTKVWTCYEDVHAERTIVWKWKGKPLTIQYCMFGGKHTFTKVLRVVYEDDIYHKQCGTYETYSKPNEAFLKALLNDIAGKNIVKLKRLYKFLYSIGFPEQWAESDDLFS